MNIAGIPPVSSESRYLPTYREDELRLIFHYARRGESLCYVGIAGIGKSNIVTILNHDYAFRRRYLNDEADRIHFPRIDGNTWDSTPTGLWRLMLERLQIATAHLPTPTIDPKIISLNEEDTYRRRLQTQINHICQVLQHKLMFVLDDFDIVFKEGPLHMLEQFDSFRSDGNKGRLSYLIITKQLPTVLGRRFELEKRSKFYDLFRMNIFALTPYRRADAVHMLHYLNQQANAPLDRKELAQIHYLCGGHARLLKVVFEAWLKQPPATVDIVKYFADSPDIHQTCERIFIALHRQEREAAVLIAHNRQSEVNPLIVDHLRRRGLLREGDSLEWFSPLWAEFLRRKRL